MDAEFFIDNGIIVIRRGNAEDIRGSSLPYWRRQLWQITEAEGFIIRRTCIQIKEYNLNDKDACVCSPTVRIIAFQAIDPGSTPGRRIF